MNSDGIRVNGEWQALATLASPDTAAPTVADLLASHGLVAGTRGVAVAVNGAVVPSHHWAQTALATGDSVEIVRPLQGG